VKLIEYGHLYVDDLLRKQYNTQSLQQGVMLARQIAGPADTCWVLLDDKALSLTDQTKMDVIKQAYDLFEELGLIPQHFHFEKTFSGQATQLIEALPQHCLRWESFHKSNKKVLFYTGSWGKVPLAQHALTDQDELKIIHYSCPLLASLWRKYKQDNFEVSVTVLEKRYQNVELKVSHLLNDSGYKTTGSHSFIWH
jgi:hypothetical protein